METYNAHEVVSQILENRYFTNHGPLARALEEKLERWTGASHAVLVGSVELGLLVALIAMRAPHQARLTYLLEDYEPKLDHVGALSGLEVCALADTADMVHETDVLYRTLRSEEHCPSRSASGERVEIVEIREPWWSESRWLNVIADCPAPLLLPLPTQSGGSVILFHSDEDAEKARNVRSSYGTRKQVSVFVTCNGRYSEAQAGAVLNYLQTESYLHQ